ncbi:MAG: UDP-N-acetylglucosamine 1-carboxyvinyltransferase [Ruminococcaceae bacterium]|nr:UDP-N-acetylglucosamine 1-carboxyvinyltransferase [Oscillospiraceae bacterium]
MEKLIITGGRPLYGTVAISGMKNAALPILFACALNRETCILHNVPAVKDIETTVAILTAMGISIRYLSPTTLEVNGANFRPCTSPNAFVRRIRASSYLMGAELGVAGKTRIAFPGGCDFDGGRPLDLHMKGFEAMGAEMSTYNDGYVGEAPDGLSGAKIYLNKASVGATVNLILAATLTPGHTVISNAAREPHIVSLARFLNECGANIVNAGTSEIQIEGVSALHGCTYRIPPDMIEAGTYMAAVAGTGGSVTLTGVYPEHLQATIDKLREMGVEVIDNNALETVTVSSDGHLSAIELETQFYPGFPTDMQPQFAALMAVAKGTSVIREAIINGRFAYLEQLKRTGVKTIGEAKDTAYIEGVAKLSAANMTATDLRGGAAMVMVALMANGTSEIRNVHLIDRGYDNIEGKLTALGADIVRCDEDADYPAPVSEKSVKAPSGLPMK